jgi:hypothetical protein
MKKQKIHVMPGFEFAYIRSPKDINGTMEPFKPHWWIQYLGNGQSAIFDTKTQCIEWANEWDTIGSEN